MSAVSTMDHKVCSTAEVDWSLSWNRSNNLLENGAADKESHSLLGTLMSETERSE